MRALLPSLLPSLRRAEPVPGRPPGPRPQSHKAAEKTTRVRTVLNEKQLHTLRTCYAANPRPDALMKEQLVEMTGLSPRVIRVWFQNKRCKDKKKSILMKQLQQQQHSDKTVSGRAGGREGTGAGRGAALKRRVPAEPAGPHRDAAGGRQPRPARERRAGQRGGGADLPAALEGAQRLRAAERPGAARRLPAAGEPRARRGAVGGRVGCTGGPPRGSPPLLPQVSFSESGSLGTSSGSDVTSLSSQLPDTPNSMVPSPAET